LLELFRHRPGGEIAGPQYIVDEAKIVFVDVRGGEWNHCATIAQVLNPSSGSGQRAIVIVCAGSQGAMVADILQRSHEAGSDAVPVGFVDDTPHLLGTAVLGLDVLAPIASLGDVAHDAAIVALGDNHARRAMTERLLAAGERL